MYLSLEQIIIISTVIVSLLLLIFAVDWYYFRDWTVIFLFKSALDLTVGSPIVNMELIKYPIRLLPNFYDTSILFELWVFPILCILYNQVTRTRGLGGIIFYAFLFSLGMTAVEYPIEKYTDLIEYIHWNQYITFITLFFTFLASRAFIAFYRWGCNYFARETGPGGS